MPKSKLLFGRFGNYFLPVRLENWGQAEVRIVGPWQVGIPARERREFPQGLRCRIGRDIAVKAACKRIVARMYTFGAPVEAEFPQDRVGRWIVVKDYTSLIHAADFADM